jgi:hypothetical protein
VHGSTVTVLTLYQNFMHIHATPHRQTD